VSGAVLGDFSSMLASVPVFLGQAGYSREADAAAVQVLRAAALSPRLMVTLFDKLAAARHKKEQEPAPAKAQDHWLGIAFASHPPDAARVQFFQAAANQR